MSSDPMEAVPNPESNQGGAGLSMEALMDVSLPVVIEMGRTTLALNEIAKLKRGSVVQLDGLVGDPVSILVSDRKIAEGEVVVIGDHLGVRISKILSDAETGESA
ncbi:MAG: hypothetical protein HKN21_03365 [Candidatus Eisenbacteria bacterium]|uniref:Flagellar motor switch protein FliN-like C-terminal domain-containing protein n=1 Tax=Eiseniibacteriota bacterium TaxID=2212470 RepID=A0A7Y2E7H3_UNCEI|nr:hypothetical protein [Candidatus Eisenbacteria bacterium]